MVNRFATILIGIVLCTATTFGAHAAGFPDKPVQLVVPYSPGGITDNLARLYAERLQSLWKQPVIVENRPGAGGSIGAGNVARAPADGYTVLLGSVGMVTNGLLLKKLPYDAKALTPLALAALAPNVLYVHPSVPATTTAELVDYAKRNPGKLSFASSGVGSSPHLAAELFAARAGIDVLQVPYGGTGPALADFLGGQVNAYFDTMQSMSYAKSGKIRALAVTTSTRLADEPGLPTVEESGVAPGVVSSSWFGFFLPSATPPATQAAFAAALADVSRDPQVQSRLKALGVVPDFRDQQAFTAFVKDEAVKWEDVIRTQKISIQ